MLAAKLTMAKMVLAKVPRTNFSFPGSIFSKTSLSQRADFEVQQSGNMDKKENVKTILFLFIKICPNHYMIKSN